MSLDGQQLLDESDWMVESTAILAIPDPVALSWVSLQLEEELPTAGLESGELGPVAMERLLLAALDLNVELDHDSFVLLRQDADDQDALRRILTQFAESSEIRVEGFDVVGVLEELPIPVFQSRPKITKALKEYVLTAGEVAVAIGHVAPFVVGGHVAVVLVAVAPPIGGALIIGPVAGLAGAAVAGRLRRRARAGKPEITQSPSSAPTEDLTSAGLQPGDSAEPKTPRTRDEVRDIQKKLGIQARGLPRPGP